MEVTYWSTIPMEVIIGSGVNERQQLYVCTPSKSNIWLDKF